MQAHAGLPETPTKRVMSNVPVKFTGHVFGASRVARGSCSCDARTLPGSGTMARIGSLGLTGPEAKQLSTYALLPITAAYRSGIELAKTVDRGVWSASMQDQISPIRPELLAPELRGLKDFELKILSSRPHVDAPGGLAVANLSEGAGSPTLLPREGAEGQVWETELFGIHRIEPIAPRSLKPRECRQPRRADTCAINAPTSTPVTDTGAAADFGSKPKRELAQCDMARSSRPSRSSSRSSRSAAAGANPVNKGGTTPRGCPEDEAWRRVVSAAQKEKVEEPQLQTGGANSAPVAAGFAASSGALQPLRGPRAEASPRMPAQLAIVSAPLPPRRATGTATGDFEPVPPEDAAPLPPRRAAIHYGGSVYTEPYVEPAVAQNRMEVAVARAVGAPRNCLPAGAARASGRKLSPRRPPHAADISSQKGRALPTQPLQPTQLTKGKASPRPPVVNASLSPPSSSSSLRRSAAAAAAAAALGAVATAPSAIAEIEEIADIEEIAEIEEGKPARLPILPPSSLRQWARQRVIKDENLPACTFNPGEIIMFGGSAQERAALGRMLVRMGEAHTFSRHAPRARALGSRGALLSSRSNRSSRGCRSRKASRQGSPEGLSGSHSAREALPNMAPEPHDGIRAPRPPVHSDAAIAAGPWPPRPPPHPAPPISGGDTKVYRRLPKFGIQTANLQPDQWHIESAASPAAAAMLLPPPERFANAGRASGARAGRPMLPSVDQASPALTSTQGALRARQVKDVVEGYESAGGGEDQDAIAGWPSAWLVQPTVA
jgi:hypothetical protein